MTALLVLIVCFAGTAPSVFGQPNTTINPQPNRTVIPIHIDQGSGDIIVGLTTYHGAFNALHLLAIKRKPNFDQNGNPLPPTVIGDQVFTAANTPADANQFLQNILKNTPDALLIANGVNNQYSISPGSIAASLEQFGGQVDLEGLPDAVNIVFVGNGGRYKGRAFERLFYTDNVDGYLATDTQKNYGFIQTDYLRYDITTDGTIKIGTKTYPVANAAFKEAGCDAAASDSFHLVVVDRESPQTLLVDNAYCTGQNPVHLGYMAGDLKGVTSEGDLVFIASNGHPIPADWNFGTDGDARVYPLAQDMPYLGGYWETLVYMTPTDAYSLVGAPPPPSYVAGARLRARESSSVYPNQPTGELHVCWRGGATTGTVR